MCSDGGRETELTLNNWILFGGDEGDTESNPFAVLHIGGWTRRADVIFLNYRKRENRDVGSGITLGRLYFTLGYIFHESNPYIVRLWHFNP